ncbi:gliding motility-associated C-terminal domain-containing protein [Flavobacterium omnivorum]|uniref:Gliding motility-associated C-terminal domain-containing protein n=1 Tax=Flavobacterium omnivorum TaxID=178355 RepID=A0A1G8EYU4_9FLAO|nr:T9SS type B sorting domain-containing protein [Flavobacterium omnivorum]SDH75022.1 gliding motility-associated C-terminal domain-containing protein [Flavobacterium omnivorum]
MKKTLLIFFIFLSISCFAQFSKTHYIPPLSGSNSVAAQDQYLYISTPSVIPVKVKINAIGVGITEIIVSKNSPVEYNVGFGTNTQLHVDPSLLNTPLSDKGFIIEAENLIYVAARVIAGNFNQAGSLISKGLSAIGNEFRVGAFVNTGTANSGTFRYTFLSILATENNTVVDFSDIKPGVTLMGNATVGNTPPSVTLNTGQSYILATEDISIANKDGLIGALVKSNKPIVMNCGSYGGTNGNISGNLDLGFDQIVPAQRIGNEYIFVRGLGLDILERPLLVAHQNDTYIYLNGSTIPFNTTPLNAGQYIILDGTNYSVNGSLYVKTNKNIFAYQSVGSSSQANQEMFFVPPLNCSTPNIVDNIPMIEKIGSTSFTTNSGLNIVTEKDAIVEIAINGVRQPVGVSPRDVIGNGLYETYTVTGLTGNISVFSTKQVYVSYFGSNNAATYGGYYSGFDTKPEIITDEINVGSSSCIPNVTLKVSSISSYNTFEWYFNNFPIANSNNSSYPPTKPGYYQVKGSISGCSSPPVLSDLIPVSTCETDIDNDSVNDNIDIDNDNDGITNCTESYGNQDINTSNANGGNIATGLYSNSFSGAISTSTAASATPFTGNNNGSFITQIPAGKGNFVSYKMTFAQPISLGMEYVTSANASDLLNADSDYTINSDVDKTITVLNPNNQLLIDTNYDGIYESGVTQYSSFEIRFRLNSSAPLASGTGTFKFLTYLSNSLSFTHRNLSETNANKSTFKFFASCVPKDSDGDGTPDQLDSDSDNDGILDLIESQPNASVALSNSDTNKNGLDNAFEPGLIPIDTDNDGVPDYLDLDSDNDGITDAIEIGNLGTDTDTDGIKNYRDLDSDGDSCSDVIEAGFMDPNGDGLLGSIAPPSVNSYGLVTSGLGYTTPNNNYIIAAPIVITSQPLANPSCESENTTITLVDNGNNTYQWQVSSNGTTWNPIINNVIYSGATTNTLVITSVKNTMNGYKYRVQLNKAGNSCGLLSDDTSLTVYTLPTVNNVTIIQCDADLDAVTAFNLTVKNDAISSNFANEDFFYYTSLDGATTGNVSELINTPTSFTNTTPGMMTVWARVVNANGCFSVAELNLKVLVTQIPSTFKRTYMECDDFLDENGNNNSNNNNRDGISSFDLSSTETDIKTLLPVGNYTVTFYRNQTDALAEKNAITTISNYRNIGYQNTQEIWGRVDSDVDNACYGLGPYVSLTVEKLPFANVVTVPRQCDDNQDGIYTFNTSTLESDILKGQTNVTITYFDKNNNLLPSPFPPTFTTESQTIKAVVTNSTTLSCSDATTIVFIVDDLPLAFPIATALTTVCDDEADPLLQDGKYGFDTSAFQNTILGGQTGMNVKYFDRDGASLPSPLPNPFFSSTQDITATVENTINSNCTASVIIPFIVNPLPPINLNLDGSEDELVCSNLPTFFVTLEAGIQDGSATANYTYVWSKDGVVLSGQSNATLDVNAEGNYTVEVITTLGCSRSRKIKVKASDIATITTIDIADLTDINTVTVNVSGKGKYEFSLNEPSGPYQSSNVFTNIPSGIYDVFINDINGCGTVSKTISVIGVPKYFTPNNDGYNDFWNVKGINANFNAKSTIYIFDRYGKLLKQLIPTSEGWDGTFTGLPLPSDDYWYTIKLEDGREAKGHFSLKR